jgi:uncharacterized protein
MARRSSSVRRIRARGARTVCLLSLVGALATIGVGSAQSPAPVSPPSPRSSPTEAAPIEDPARTFVAQVLATTEDVWAAVFKGFGQRYQEPTLVLYSDVTAGACGRQDAISGPVYCERDNRVYLDLAFFKALQDTLKAPGDFARAYVIAHEIGHHVQNQLGILKKVEGLEQSFDARQRNALSVRVELQADCLAGVWAGVAQKMWPTLIEPGDIEAGLRAASAVGADAMQRAATGIVVPENFTHGTSAQRMRWFRRGMETAQIQQCDTFNAPEL